MNLSDKFTLDGVSYAVTVNGNVVEVRVVGADAAMLVDAVFDAKTRTVGGGTWTTDPGPVLRRGIYRWATNAIRIRLGGTLLA